MNDIDMDKEFYEFHKEPVKKSCDTRGSQCGKTLAESTSRAPHKSDQSTLTACKNSGRNCFPGAETSALAPKSEKVRASTAKMENGAVQERRKSKGSRDHLLLLDGATLFGALFVARFAPPMILMDCL